MTLSSGSYRVGADRDAGGLPPTACAAARGAAATRPEGRLGGGGRRAQRGFYRRRQMGALAKELALDRPRVEIAEVGRSAGRQRRGDAGRLAGQPALRDLAHEAVASWRRRRCGGRRRAGRRALAAPGSRRESRCSGTWATRRARRRSRRRATCRRPSARAYRATPTRRRLWRTPSCGALQHQVGVLEARRVRAEELQVAPPSAGASGSRPSVRSSTSSAE